MVVVVWCLVGDVWKSDSVIKYDDRRPYYCFLYLDQVTQFVGGKNTDTGKCNTHSSPPPDRQTDPSACLVFPLTVITNTTAFQCHVKCKWSQSEKEANISEDMAGDKLTMKKANTKSTKSKRGRRRRCTVMGDNEHEHECVNVRCPLIHPSAAAAVVTVADSCTALFIGRFVSFNWSTLNTLKSLFNLQCLRFTCVQTTATLRLIPPGDEMQCADMSALSLSLTLETLITSFTLSYYYRQTRAVLPQLTDWLKSYHYLFPPFFAAELSKQWSDCTGSPFGVKYPRKAEEEEGGSGCAELSPIGACVYTRAATTQTTRKLENGENMRHGSTVV